MITVTNRHRKKIGPVPAQGTRVVTTVHMTSTLNAPTQPAKAASQEKERRRKYYYYYPLGPPETVQIYSPTHTHTHTKARFGSS